MSVYLERLLLDHATVQVIQSRLELTKTWIPETPYIPEYATCDCLLQTTLSSSTFVSLTRTTPRRFEKNDQIRKFET